MVRRSIHVGSVSDLLKQFPVVAIRDVTNFVELHKGQWPKSWDDFPAGNNARQFVRMRFDVTVDELVADRDLIHSVIVPISGEYRTYPHAESQLNQLRATLVRFQKQRR